MWQINNIDENTMKKFAYRWGKLLQAGDIICLDGDLGAGKTTLTQSIARGMNITDYVNSPSYTIICEYQPQIDDGQKDDTIKNGMEKSSIEDDNRPPLYHMDVYRLADEDELYEIGFDEYIDGDGVCVIEWACKIENALPEDVVRVYISLSVDGDARNIIVDYDTNNRNISQVDDETIDVYRDRWGDLFESFGFRYQHTDGDSGAI